MTNTLKQGRIVQKPWGQEEIWAECESYLGKIITVNPGCRLSRQYHVEKEETIRVLSGLLHLETGNDTDRNVLIASPGETFHVNPGTVHRFCCKGDTDLILLEVSTSHINDVVRLEDDYNR